MTDYDLMIRGGTIIDGTGSPGFEGDVAVVDGRIAAVGAALRGHAKEEIDARGLLVTPGFVDIHTHYDGQVTWGDRITPSSEHGVTTVVMGNCGVGFAPCKPEHREELIRLMQGVEDIPEAVMAEGLPWNWRTFPDYLDFLDGRSYDIDVAAQFPHAPVRVFVMGQRGIEREPATEVDCAEMARLAREAVASGALGFTTSRSINHRSASGNNMPSYDAAEQELQTIADGVATTGRGVLQMIDDFGDATVTPEHFAMIRRLSERSGLPISFTVLQLYQNPQTWRQVLTLLEGAAADGVKIRGQVLPRSLGVIMGLEGSRHPFSASATFQEMARLPFAEMIDRLREPDVRNHVIEETVAAPRDLFSRFEHMYPLGEMPDYEPARENSIAVQAERRGLRPEDVAFDQLLSLGGHGLLLGTFGNYFDGSLDNVLTMLRSESTVVGLGDGGAHCSLICDGSYSTYLLSYWGRDRTRGDRLPLPFIVNALTRQTAETVGLLDRGIVAPGYKADLNVIDMDRVRLPSPRYVYDLPANGRRLAQSAEGYVATIVNGVVIARDGVPTDARPGRLVRGQQQSPEAIAA